VGRYRTISTVVAHLSVGPAPIVSFAAPNIKTMSSA